MPEPGMCGDTSKMTDAPFSPERGLSVGKALSFQSRHRDAYVSEFGEESWLHYFEGYCTCLAGGDPRAGQEIMTSAIYGG